MEDSLVLNIEDNLEQVAKNADKLSISLKNLTSVVSPNVSSFSLFKKNLSQLDWSLTTTKGQLEALKKVAREKGIGTDIADEFQTIEFYAKQSEKDLEALRKTFKKLGDTESLGKIGKIQDELKRIETNEARKELDKLIDKFSEVNSKISKDRMDEILKPESVFDKIQNFKANESAFSKLQNASLNYKSLSLPKSIFEKIQNFNANKGAFDKLQTQGTSLNYESLSIPKTVKQELEEFRDAFDELGAKGRQVGNIIKDIELQVNEEELEHLKSSFASFVKTLGLGSEEAERLGKEIEKIGFKTPATNLDLSTQIEQIEKFQKTLRKLGDTKSANLLNELKKSISTLDEDGGLVKLKKDILDFANQSGMAEKEVKELEKSLKKLNSTSFTVKNSVKKLSDLFQTLWNVIKSGWIIRTIFRAFDGIQNITKHSTQFVETLNLWNVALGESTKKAEGFIEKMSEVFGLDSKELMDFQGQFHLIANAIGLTEKNANTLSETMTKLGVDLASLYNVDVETAMQKLSSGLVGETEPLRRWGIDVSEASIKQEALKLGIEKGVNAMTYAEKTQLRYLAILNQTTKAQGDFARTIETTANQQKVLTAQVTLLCREIGNIFIPLLQKVLPYVISVVVALKEMAHEVALFFGFKLPEIDYDNVSNTALAFEEVEENVAGATGRLKEFKKQLLGVDEINNITPPTQTKGGSGYGADDGGFNLDLKGYDNLINSVTKQVGEMAKKFKPALKIIIAFVGALAGFFILKRIKKLFDKVWDSSMIDDFYSAIKNGGGIIEFIKGKFDDMFSVLKGGLSLTQKLVTAFGGLILIGIGSFIADLADKFRETNGILGYLVETVGNLVSGLGGALIGFTLLGPVGAIIGGIAGAFIPVIDNIVETIKLNNNLKDTVNEISKEYDKIVTSIKDRMNEELVEVTVIENMKKELEGYTDENGKINEKYRYRAEILLKQINEKLGTSYTITDDLFIKEGDRLLTAKQMTDEINKTIEAKKREIYLEAYREISVETAKKQIELQKQMTELKAKEERQQDTLNAIIAEGGKIGSTTQKDMQKALKTTQDRIKDLEKTGEDMSKNMQTYTDLYTAHAQGNIEKFDEIVGDVLGNTKKTAEETNKELDKQSKETAKNVNKNLGEIKDRKVNITATADTSGARTSINSLFRDLNKSGIFSSGLLTGIATSFINLLPIHGYATGGFPEDGWFRASKGELIGKFDDGQSVVANNMQIIEGIKQGVYSAVVSAMGGVNSGNGNVYLDDQIVGVIVNKINEQSSNYGNNPVGFRIG